MTGSKTETPARADGTYALQIRGARGRNEALGAQALQAGNQQPPPIEWPVLGARAGFVGNRQGAKHVDWVILRVLKLSFQLVVIV